MKKFLAAALLVSLVSPALVSTASAQSDLLPDIIVNDDELYDRDIISQGGRTYLRLSNGTANAGAGKLYLYGGQSYPDNTQDVIQRVYRTNGTFWERAAGRFVYHPAHNHIHFENWCIYRLRERLPNDGVGDVVAQGSKTSFCILDLVVYDPTLPGFPPGGQFRTCDSTTQGLSVGWMDVYSKNLAGQTIDITGLPTGDYWLESEVDPANHVLESNEANNATRVAISIYDGSLTPPDAYEPNGTLDEVKGRTEGALSSPNLGPVGPSKVISGLNLHAPGNVDWYRFYSPGAGTSSDYIRIDFVNSQGNLDLRLFDDTGTAISGSFTNQNFERINLTGLPRGWYSAMVSAAANVTNPAYSFTVNPATSATPSVEVTEPSIDLHLVHGVDTVKVEWIATDPDNDATWVTVYANTTPAFNGSEVLIPTSLNTPGALGSHVVNSAYLDHGTYYFAAVVTDGSTTSTSWSTATATFDENGCLSDVDHNGFVNGDDYDAYAAYFEAGQGEADLNHDGFVNGDDFDHFAEHFEAGC
ncbi:MAG: hypothetical protein JNL50_05365 [Phycisphaerae bacterium]|nr:hypothetical protein [Phycisphaerae bacterium]